jgi:hypothetical protein
LLDSLQVLRISNILIECISFQRLCTSLSKRRGHGYVMGSVDKIIFTLKHDTDFLLIQIYMDDIIFSGSSHYLMSRF